MDGADSMPDFPAARRFDCSLLTLSYCYSFWWSSECQIEHRYDMPILLKCPSQWRADLVSGTNFAWICQEHELQFRCRLNEFCSHLHVGHHEGAIGVVEMI